MVEHGIEICRRVSRWCSWRGAGLKRVGHVRAFLTTFGAEYRGTGEPERRLQTQNIVECDLRTGAGNWRTIRVAEARALRSPILRCPACHGPGTVAGVYTEGREQYRFAHRRAHAGCYLSAQFSGTHSIHPEASDA